MDFMIKDLVIFEDCHKAAWCRSKGERKQEHEGFASGFGGYGTIIRR